MTRDEAIKILDDKFADSKSQNAMSIDCLVALGILKLDEPKSEIDRLAENIGWSRKGLSDALNRAGLKLVKK